MNDKRQQIFHEPFDTLEEFVDAISEHLECPVTIEDANHHLLAYSSHDDQTDSARVRTIIGRRVPEQVINRFWKEGVIPTLNQSDEPQVISEINDIGLGNRVAVSIRQNKEVLGYIWVLEVGRSLSDQDLADLTFFAGKAKSLLLQLKKQRSRKEKNHQELLWQILTGDLRDHQPIADQLSRIGINTNRALGIIVFTFPELDRELYKKLIYAAKTIQKMDILIQTLDDNRLVFLVSPFSQENEMEETKEFIYTFKRQINERFGISDLDSGSGYMYENYTFIKRSYEEAVKVASLKKTFYKELSHVNLYHELGIFRYIDLLKKYDEVQDMPPNPAIQRLSAYDQENRTNLLESLEAILEKDGNMNAAAKSLHCHVNTLNYRLKRIQELTSIQLKDPVQKLGLYLDIKLSNQR
ncbi:CdaR family transcriptional regulator [Halobacillus sp. Marseille-Q1614]|uniref:PucR family transcriptional regulator n=1 Tax=Halobacillus sp. Marseille-Q1614 TaxID=2709134 RepID=UPI00157038C9|nr:helix-turn-helix domain-containing protein [Halobacillus sp. Marseille-Q1614]